MILFKNNHVYRGIAILLVMLLCTSFIHARRVIQASDKLQPRWCMHPTEIGRYRHYATQEYTYDYKCIKSIGPDLKSLKASRKLDLQEGLQQTYKIEGNSTAEFTHLNQNGDYHDTDSYSIIFHMTSTSEKFDCQFIDDYWERYADGEYVLYTLYAVSIPGTEPHFDSYQPSTHYEPAKGLVRSLIPGWGQIYKGSKIKGGLIITGEAIGVGGIITCYSMKSSYEKLMQEDPKHLKEYSMSADMWQNIGYGCIAFTAAVYIYNLIDAALAPGARQIRVYPRDHAFKVSPNVTMDGSVGFAMKYNF